MYTLQLSKFKAGELVNVFSFDTKNINLAPPDCFSHTECTGCLGHKGNSCSLNGPQVSKDDILTIVDCRSHNDVTLFQMVLLMTPTGLLGSIDSKMLDYVPETKPGK